MAVPIIDDLKRYKRWLFEANVDNPIDRLRFYGYVACTVLTLLGCSLHFFGILGIKRPELLTISFIWICTDGILLVLFMTRRVMLRTAFIISAITSQLIESARLFYLSFSGTIIPQQFYINVFICFAILMVVVIGFLYRTAILLAVLNMVTILICRYAIPDIVNSMTISFFVLLDIALCAYSIASVAFVKQITRENNEVKGKYNSFLSFMRMNDAEASSLIQLARTAFDSEKHVDELVDHLHDETKANLINVARHIYSRQLAREDNVRERFPQLSPTEVTVCLLVVTGHSQKDIARIMDKTENNISTVRGNIRRKLNLETSQDLREYLVNSLDDNRETGGVFKK